MAVIGFGAHTERSEATGLAEETAAWLRSMGHEVRMLTLVGDPPVTGDGPPPSAPAGELAGLDLVISFGGDGTMLRTIGLLDGSDVPVLGVNLGNLGYLTVVEPEDLKASLKRFLAGDYILDARMRLAVEVRAEGGLGPVLLASSALNDVVLQRPGGVHTVRAALSIGGHPFLTYLADALLVATPTGSTAYNLSARGPVLSPGGRALIVTPVAPHMLFDRSLVLDEEESVSIAPVGRAAEVVIDGWLAHCLRPGEVITCRQASTDAHLVRFHDWDYLDILKRKFHLGEP